MLLIIGTVRLPSEKLAEARPVMERMILASRAEAGCLEYSYAEDVLVAGRIHVKEIWLDQVSLDAHFASDHIRAWRAAWPQLGIADRNLSVYEIGEARAT
ncbi:MAG TPA: putative quinol monooxygenase [Mesorhizobium sp.]|jgi:quinol monooxygenase YgiN|uniref:putative quinol monooxygenase n=1 Tax=Mesorhizobium sp. TaxID=1871066 RepID=UPI002DDCFBCC|nr:putative quinol monooxygenase [Mesorhizobium sp.]HEV2506849.1 putative quinol monooxygenase [Mesorhizobium sp.]